MIKENNVLDGPEFGRGVGELPGLLAEQRKKIKRAGEVRPDGSVQTAEYLTLYMCLKRREERIKTRVLSDMYRRLSRAGKESVKAKGVVPGTIGVESDHLGEQWND